MDPVATLRKLLDALDTRDAQDAYDACSDLAEWIDRGGYLPTVVRFTSNGTDQVLYTL